MDTKIAPSQYEALEKDLRDLRTTLDTNYNSQQECQSVQNRETQQFLQTIHDQQRSIQGQLSDISDSLKLLRRRYMRAPLPPLTVGHGVPEENRAPAEYEQGRVDVDQKSTDALDKDDPPPMSFVAARSRRKSWASATVRGAHGSSISSGSEDERIRYMEIRTNCMASAIKRNFVRIVETLPFKESEIPDSIIETCVTESECEYIRGLPDRRNQVRTLVTMVIRRSLLAMDFFVEIVSQHDAALHKNIQDTYNELLEERRGSRKPCTLCTLVRKVDIKDVCDHFYERELLSDSLYSEIICSHSSEELWQKMLDSMADKSHDVIMSVIIGALEHHGTFYANIVRMLGRDIQRRRQLKCRCRCPLFLQPSSIGDTSSAMSSLDVLSFFQETEILNDSCDVTPTAAKPVLHRSQSESAFSWAFLDEAPRERLNSM